MKKPVICAVIADTEFVSSKEFDDLADLYEVRIDLIGSNWKSIAKKLEKPWIATNRSSIEGGKWVGTEDNRISELLAALPLGAAIIDIELNTPELRKIVPLIKKDASCLVSYHNLQETPGIDILGAIIRQGMSVEADMYKVVTMANRFEDNLTMLRLINEFADIKIVSFAMGAMGLMSRILCPMIGGIFTYGAIDRNKESAPSQLTVGELNEIYEMMLKCQEE